MAWRCRGWLIPEKCRVARVQRDRPLSLLACGPELYRLSAAVRKTTFQLKECKTQTILKKISGERITGIRYGGKKVDSYFVDRSDLEAVWNW
jgi:histone acetyltransferase (RNA polymerase elongator complex component)